MDECLCRLGRSIASAISALPVTAEQAHADIRNLRRVLHAAIDARCDELEAGVSSSEALKIQALERELVAVDSHLERWKPRAEMLARQFPNLAMPNSSRSRVPFYRASTT